jgi:mannose-1-phosphate guanylyltransferase
MPKISIDYAVMEKTSKTFVVPTSFAWDDLGDWTALERLIDKQGSNPNTVVGNHIGFETHDSIIYSENDNDVFVTVGVENLVIVKRNNTILISHKDKVQDIKKVLLDKRVAELSQV